MSVVAQIGLDGIGRVLLFLNLAAFWGSLLSLLLFLTLWYLPEIRELISDKIRGTDPYTRWEADRKLEGRLFATDDSPPEFAKNHSEELL